MDTQVITTPSGYVVTVKKALSYRHKLDIQEALIGGNSFKMDAAKPNTDKVEVEVSFANLFAYRKLAMKYLVVKVIDPDKQEAADPYEAVMDMPEDDAQVIADAVAEVTSSTKK